MPERPLKDLINTSDPAWPLVQEWIAEAQNSVELLPSNREQGETVLLFLQVTTRSPMGALALETGGLLIDHGWLRLLGAGHDRMQGNLRSWNMDREASNKSALPGALIVAHDAIG